MTEEKKEMTNEEPIILTFDDVPYRASDLKLLEIFREQP